MADIVTDKTVVSFHYKLHNNDGELLDASEADEPMSCLIGAHNIVPGLDKALLDKKLGDKFEVKVPAAEGYGERIDAIVPVPRSNFPADVELAIGMSFMVESPDGDAFPLWIVKLSDDEVTADANHPLAGMDLNFDVEITAIRVATEEELAHGHPHGPGGHHH